ncbi:MAG: PadR family transcriptional regulator [Ilumatobacteraceae bacterium]|nr:PadR family transcriptional regulator [Ilumatobacteraceae bacterium]
MPKLKPTHTSYAVLGLLALQPWTTYELARQSERSLRWFFPRAERAVYLEAKRLVQLGWATSEATPTGQRPSTVYSITRAGRRAFKSWLGEPSGPTQIESEAALKTFFADQSTLDDMRATVAGMRDQAAASLATLSDMSGRALAGEAPFPERRDITALSLRLIVDMHRAIHDWTNWVGGQIDVLESGDRAAIDRQTATTMRSITGTD